MSTPTGDKAFLHELELNVRAELTLAEASQPGSGEETAPIDEWLFDPADAQREEVLHRNLLGAVSRGPRDGSRPDDHLLTEVREGVTTAGCSPKGPGSFATRWVPIPGC